MHYRMRSAIVAACLAGAFPVLPAVPVFAACTAPAEGARQVFFGDLHVHTSFSIDAYAVGVRVDPADAFAFARGQELTLSDRETRVRLRRPLDFAAVTDHAEYFDVTYHCTDPTYSDVDYCVRLRQTDGHDPALPGFRQFVAPMFADEHARRAPLCSGNEALCRNSSRSQWRRVQEMANEANEPCRFTAFVGNEWSATPNMRHWHRNLIFASEKVPEFPINAVDQPTVDDLWESLEKLCRPEDGCDVVAIPHNMNLAEGGGFDVETAPEVSLRRRARYERLAEIYQHKGSSECMPAFGADDTGDCGFELSLPSRFTRPGAVAPDEATWNRIRSVYYRNLLGRGLQMQQRRRINPLQLGAMASTDTHDGTAGAVDEEAWRGGFGLDVNAAVRFSLFPNWSPGGLVAVWAEENTRQSVFAALKRREVYGTSGPRIVLRFFAAPASGADPCRSGAVPEEAIPMGGTLPDGRRFRPRFVVQALMDREPLERIEIVRGVLGPAGVEEELITLPTGTNSSGSSVCAVFRDEHYDPARPAYWYARVLERPTWRWSRHDCETAGNCTPASSSLIRERAWSSPIWRLP